MVIAIQKQRYLSDEKNEEKEEEMQRFDGPMTTILNLMYIFIINIVIYKNYINIKVSITLNRMHRLYN